MGLLDIFSRKSSSTVSSPMDLMRLADLLASGRGKGAAAVTWQTSLRVATVFACARVIANGISQVPFRLYRALPKGGREPEKNHPLHWIASLRWNEFQTSFEARQMVGLHLALTNNAYIYKVLSPTGKLLELLPLDPASVAAKRNADGTTTYRVRLADGTFMDVASGLMWHVKYLTWDGTTGLDAVKLARGAIGLAMDIEEQVSQFFGNGARLSGILTTDAKMDAAALQLMRESWQETYSGASNAYKTAVLANGLKYQTIAAQADHSQTVQQRSAQVEEICRGFGVLPIMVGYSDKTATYASAEAMFQAHVTHTMMPIYECIDQSATINLLTRDEWQAGLYFKLTAQGLLRGSIKDRGDYYAKLYSIGALNPNEIRELEDRNPYEGGEQYRVPLNMVDPLDEPDLPPPPPPQDSAVKNALEALERAVKAVADRPSAQAPNINITTPPVTIADGAIKVQSPVSVNVDAKRGDVLREVLEFDGNGMPVKVIEKPI